jgi:hypothetical protein
LKKFKVVRFSRSYRFSGSCKMSVEDMPEPVGKQREVEKKQRVT